MCGVYGQHWGGPEGDAFGRAARRFEQLGVGALLVNCIPPDHVDGMVVATCATSPTCRSASIPTSATSRTAAGGSRPASAARSTRAWRCAGARRARRSSAAAAACGPSTSPPPATRWRGTPPGAAARRPPTPATTAPAAGDAAPAPWTDRRGAPLYPLPFPELVVRARRRGARAAAAHGVAVPAPRGRSARTSAASTSAAGAASQTVQLALNGATHVHAIDIDGRAVAQHAGQRVPQRRGRSRDRRAVDLYPWVPEERYEVIVASLQQKPIDPFQHAAHAPPGRLLGARLLDQLLLKLPERSRPRASPTSCSSRSSPSSARRSCSTRRGCRRGRRLRAVPVRGRSRRRGGPDRARRGA